VAQFARRMPPERTHHLIGEPDPTKAGEMMMMDAHSVVGREDLAMAPREAAGDPQRYLPELPERQTNY
jgi:hypothetical protein